MYDGRYQFGDAGKDDQSVTTDSLLKICIALHCDISDIMEIAQDIPSQRGHEKE